MPKAFPSMFFFSPGSGIQKEANIRIAQADSNPFNSSMPNFQLNLKFEMKEKKREKRKKERKETERKSFAERKKNPKDMRQENRKKSNAKS